MFDRNTTTDRARGLSLAELVATLGLLTLIGVMAVPLVNRAMQAAAVRRLQEGGRTLYASLQRYQEDNGHPPRPAGGGDDGFNLRTLAPLTTGGYLTDPGSLLARFRDARVLAYDTPGLPGREGFWLIVGERTRPEIQLLIASTDQFPLTPDTFLEGLFLIEDATVRRLEGPPLPAEESEGDRG